MNRRVLLVEHMPSNIEDRLTHYLIKRGFELEVRCPARGDPLPAIDEGHMLAVVHGGIQSANDETELAYIRAEIDWIERWVGGGRPYLGLCLGGQLLARALGATVSPHPGGLYEIGFFRITPTAHATAFLPAPLHVYHWHREGFEVPQGAELLAVGEAFYNQAFRYGESAYGLQFHPEATPDILRAWIDETNDALDQPGAHSRQRQLADAARFDAKMGAWFERFMDEFTASLRADTRSVGRRPESTRGNG